MIFKKRKFQHNSLGELVYSNGQWAGTIKHPIYNEIEISVYGEETDPSKPSIEQAVELLTTIRMKVNEAEDYLTTVDISEFSKDSGELVFDGFYSDNALGQYDLYFGLSRWDDASIVVHFKNGQPYEISLGD